MIHYLVDTSALWRLIRNPEVHDAWGRAAEAGVIGSCQPQRSEFVRSARDRDEYDEMTDMFARVYPDVPVHKSVWRWVAATQYRLAAKGTHQGLSVVHLLVAATAAHHGMIVLHDDADFATIADVVADVRQQNVHRHP